MLQTYNISEVVHGQSESKDVGILVVSIDVLPVGQPDEVPVQLLSLGLVALAMLGLPQLPLLWVLELHLSCCQSTKEEDDSSSSLHGVSDSGILLRWEITEGLKQCAFFNPALSYIEVPSLSP